METLSEHQHEAAFERAERSRRIAAEALAAAENQPAPSPLAVAGVAALQEQAKIDALLLISYDLGALRLARSYDV